MIDFYSAFHFQYNRLWKKKVGSDLHSWPWTNSCPQQISLVKTSCQIWEMLHSTFGVMLFEKRLINEIDTIVQILSISKYNFKLKDMMLEMCINNGAWGVRSCFCTQTLLWTKVKKRKMKNEGIQFLNSMPCPKTI